MGVTNEETEMGEEERRKDKRGDVAILGNTGREAKRAVEEAQCRATQLSHGTSGVGTGDSTRVPGTDNIRDTDTDAGDLAEILAAAVVQTVIGKSLSSCSMWKAH